jgi:hypothetical protein
LPSTAKGVLSLRATLRRLSFSEVAANKRSGAATACASPSAHLTVARLRSGFLSLLSRRCGKLGCLGGLGAYYPCRRSRRNACGCRVGKIGHVLRIDRANHVTSKVCCSFKACANSIGNAV